MGRGADDEVRATSRHCRRRRAAARMPAHAPSTHIPTPTSTLTPTPPHPTPPHPTPPPPTPPHPTPPHPTPPVAPQHPPGVSAMRSVTSPMAHTLGTCSSRVQQAAAGQRSAQQESVTRPLQSPPTPLIPTTPHTPKPARPPPHPTPCTHHHRRTELREKSSTSMAPDFVSRTPSASRPSCCTLGRRPAQHVCAQEGEGGGGGGREGGRVLGF